MRVSGAATMAKGRKPGFKTTAVKIEMGLARKARTIAEDKGVDLSDYLTSIIRGPIERDWAKVLKKIVESQEEQP